VLFGEDTTLEHDWGDFLSPDGLLATLSLLKSPNADIHRVLDSIQRNQVSFSRKLTIEYSPPAVPHFFPILLTLRRQLLDTFHIAEEVGVVATTLTRLETVQVSHRVLAESLSARLGGVSVDSDTAMLQALLGVPVRAPEDSLSLLWILEELAEGRSRPPPPDTDGTVAQAETTLLEFVASDSELLRLLKLLRIWRLILVPVIPAGGRQKISVLYEFDKFAAVISRRGEWRAWTGHDAQEYLFECPRMAYSGSYHFRFRASPSDYVRTAEVRISNSQVFKDGYLHPRLGELRTVRESDLDVQWPVRHVDNLAHVHTSSTLARTASTAPVGRFFVKVSLRERPLGLLGAAIVRVMVAVLIVVAVRVDANGLLSRPTAALGVTILFAVPALLGVTAALNPCTYIAANVSTLLAGLLSMVAGLCYVGWLSEPGDDPKAVGFYNTVYMGSLGGLVCLLLYACTLLVANAQQYRSLARGEEAGS